MKIVILGSTGSLGTQSLEVLRKYRDDFEVIGLSAHTNEKLLNEQAREFNVPAENTILGSQEELTRLATLPETDVVINVLAGLAGLEPTKAALKAGKTVLLGNKESLVAAGEEVMSLAENRLIPLDSEHNAIFEILKKFPQEKVRKIIIPCSGGPFFGKTRSELAEITVEQALAHPRWSMGAKVSLESATLLNKGLEIIEAHHIFSLPIDKIETVIHPECQIHGLVEFENNQTHAYISAPNMAEHIENALLHVLQKPTAASKIHPFDPADFTFHPVDHETFPGIKIVLAAFTKNPSKMADFLQKEEAILAQFLRGEIKFLEIYERLIQT